jgi:hypothetical protein
LLLSQGKRAGAARRKNGRAVPDMNSLAHHLDWIALAVGAVGSLLWAHNGRSAKYAAVWWLVSSLLWIAFAWLHGLPALGIRDLLGVGVALYGSYRWLQPRRPTPTSAAGGAPLQNGTAAAR